MYSRLLLGVFFSVFFLQRPILLKGHERAITCVMYNKDGDLVFTAAKDQMPTLWYAKTGERIGTYQGHQGAVWDLTVSCEFFFFREGILVQRLVFICLCFVFFLS